MGAKFREPKFSPELNFVVLNFVTSHQQILTMIEAGSSLLACHGQALASRSKAVYHAYIDKWDGAVHEELWCVREKTSVKVPYAVAVMRDNSTVG